ncbi:MAG: hypothetical protein P9M14_16300 [Candidatus Alcyoniella australis]|nr:hypothetical protein [Candidatus Alcyoniella australis]
MRPTILIIALASALLLLVAAPAQALHVQMDLPQIVEQAQLVFIGTPVEVSCEHNHAGAIQTRYRLDVERTLKGSGLLSDQNSLELTFAGGEIGEQAMVVSGVPQLALDQRYVLLVLHDGQSYLSPIVGQHQGLFMVQTEPATGRELVLTADGRMIEKIENGRLVVGARVELDQLGRLQAVVEQTPQANPEPPVSLDPDKVRVLDHRSAEQPFVDTQRAMPLNEFLETLSAMIAQDQAQ